MNKKYLIIAAVVLLVFAGFLYISTSSNTKQSRKKIDMSQMDDTDETIPTDNKANPPPPPPRKKIGKIAPPPPPPPKLKGKKLEKPKNYKSFKVTDKPRTLQLIKKGEKKKLQLIVQKGSENFDIKWFRKDGRKMTAVAVGDQFTVSSSDETIFYVAEIDDKVATPKQFFFEVKRDLPAPTEEAITETNAAAATKIPDTPTPAAEQAAETAALDTKIENTNNLIKEKQELEEETSFITATMSTDVRQKAGTPLKMAYKVDTKKTYSVSWYHRPLDKEKGTLIKGKKTLNFSLKKLNKYHQGEFYIQVKEDNGRTSKSPEYKIRIN